MTDGSGPSSSEAGQQCSGILTPDARETLASFPRKQHSATQRRRDTEQRKKRDRAQRAVESWEAIVRQGVRFPGSWKDWVTAEADVTLHWITRAVNHEQLRPPSEDACPRT